jgi:hypothetical protein
MASWTDVTRILGSVKGVTRKAGVRQWRVKDKLAAWERPLRKADLEALGDAAPEGPILAVYTPLEVKAALLKSKPRVYFTTPHFDGYPATLVQLEKISAGELRKLLAASCAERARAR